MSKIVNAFAAATLAAAVALPASAQAATITVDVAGIQTFGAFMSGGNTVLTYNLGAGAVVTDFAYDINVTAFTPSWLSEIEIYFTNTAATAGVFVTPGIGDDFAGTRSYAGAFNLAAEGLSFNLDADGVLRLEFAEGFNDSSVNPDGIFNSGSLTFTYTPGGAAVPEPASWALMIAGFGLIGAASRRRVRTSVTFA